MIAGIIIGCAALSPISQPSPTERPEEQRHNASEPGERAPQQSQNIGVAGVGASASEPPSKGEGRAAQHKGDGEPRYITYQDTAAQWLMMIASIGAVLVSIWAVLLLSDTLKATRQTIRVAAKANKVAGDASNAAHASVAVAQDTAIRQLRAYIVVETAPGGVIEVGKRIRVPMTLKNLGHTPAKNAAVASNLFIRGLPYPLDRQNQEAGPQTVSEDRPRVSIHRGLDHISPRESDFVLEKKTLDAIRAGKAAIFLSGIVIYEDVYDKERETRFRFEFSGEECFQTGRMMISREGNSFT